MNFKFHVCKNVISLLPRPLLWDAFECHSPPPPPLPPPQSPTAGEAIGKQSRDPSADSFHRAALSDVAAKMNQRFNVRMM